MLEDGVTLRTLALFAAAWLVLDLFIQALSLIAYWGSPLP